MKVGEAIAEIMKREGIEILTGYPVNHLIEFAAAADIRPVMVRQERIGLHMADAISRLTSGRKHRRVLHAARAGHRERLWRRGAGLRRERADPGAADGLCAPHRACRPELQLDRQHAQRSPSPPSRSRCRRKSPNILRRAFSRLRNGRGGPVHGRDPRRHLERGGAGAARLHAGARARATAPIPSDVREAARDAGRGEAAGDLCRPGRALRRAPGRS